MVKASLNSSRDSHHSSSKVNPHLHSSFRDSPLPNSSKANLPSNFKDNHPNNSRDKFLSNSSRGNHLSNSRVNHPNSSRANLPHLVEAPLKAQVLQFSKAKVHLSRQDRQVANGCCTRTRQASTMRRST